MTHKNRHESAWETFLLHEGYVGDPLAIAYSWVQPAVEYVMTDKYGLMRHVDYRELYECKIAQYDEWYAKMGYPQD